MEDRSRLSRLLYRILERVGASEKLRRIHRQKSVTEEIINTIRVTIHSFRYGELWNYYVCGSSYEGSVTPALVSDEDVIGCASFVPVVLDAAVAPPGESLLMVRDSWTYPGYVKLHKVKDGVPLYDYHRHPRKKEDVDQVGRICRKHFKGDNMHGPADMTIDANGVHVGDYVAAFRCCDIPQYALEWIMRQRPYGWPSRDHLQAMDRIGCMVVGVGHVHSCEKELEWRMSYTLQERMLMTNLNPVQHKVYILLKMFKKDILGNIFHEETLTSYHFKTCVLYAVQMSPPRIWTQANLINCLVWCLKLMLVWLETNFCPSYFTKHQNLFIKEGFSRIRMSLLKEMRKTVKSGHQFLYRIQSDNVGAILRNGDWRMYHELAVEEKNAYMCKLTFDCVQSIMTCVCRLHKLMSDGSYDPFSITLALEKLKIARHINNHTAEVTQSAMNHLFPSLHIHIAKGLASLTTMCPDRAVKERMMKFVDFNLLEARDIDLVNERLAVASVLYTFEKYEECFLLLHLVESDFIYSVMQMCPCTGTYAETYYDIQDKHTRNKKLARMSIRQYIKSMTACCVIFLPSAAAIAPEPLQYEMQRSLGTLPGSRDEDDYFWFDYAVVDARVYLYFLQYLVSSKIHKDVHKEVARDNLRAEIDEDDRDMMADDSGSRLGHKDTAYNLLGWIYMQEERWADAYVCFHASWKIRPFHNAAKYHMRDLLVRLAERRVQH